MTVEIYNGFYRFFCLPRMDSDKFPNIHRYSQTFTDILNHSQIFTNVHINFWCIGIYRYSQQLTAVAEKNNT